MTWYFFLSIARVRGVDSLVMVSVPREWFFGLRHLAGGLDRFASLLWMFHGSLASRNFTTLFFSSFERAGSQDFDST